MQKLPIIVCVFALQLLSGPVIAQATRIDSLRVRVAPDYTRLVFDATATPAYKVFLLTSPYRLVIDFKDTRLKQPLAQPPKTHSLFARFRTAVKNKKDLRVVIDLKKQVKPTSFTLKANGIYGNRLVVDLYQKQPTRVVKVTKKQFKRPVAARMGEIVIAIDAGHGGEDPGAHGLRGTREKDVVLSISKKLARLIHNFPGMRAVMVRNGDYYVGLRKRMEIARKAKADLFVSIHADAVRNRKVKGASVYTLSRHGASSEAARWLAKSENSSDLVGGVSLEGKGNILASVLLDLSQAATQDASKIVAENILKNIRGLGRLHQRSVQKAGFMVLKSPDIPSVLVETAFISNPSEERKLRNRHYQDKLAKAVFNGIVDYFQHDAPPATRMAATRHKIVRGDTLSQIAVRYGVSMHKLRSVNSIRNNRIMVGKVLAIPTPTGS